MEPLHTPSRGVVRSGRYATGAMELAVSDWIEALGHSEVFVCITDSAGRRTHTSGPARYKLQATSYKLQVTSYKL